MPKVKVVKTIPIAEDGIHVKKYSAGWQGEVSDAAAKLLVLTGAGVIVRERISSPAEPENKPEMLPSEGTEVIQPSEKKKEAIVETGQQSTMRVWQLSDEIGVSSAKIIELAKGMGLMASSPMSTLSMNDANKIRSSLEKSRR